MRFFRILFCLILIPTLNPGQSYPAKESNIFMYNRYTIGGDFQNVQGLQIDDDGSLLVQPYGKSVFRIRNSEYEEVLKSQTGKGFFNSYKNYGNHEFFLFERQAYVRKNNELKPLLHFNEVIYLNGYFFTLDSDVYFSMRTADTQKQIFYSYNGKTLIKTFEIKSRNQWSYIKIEKEIYLMEIDIPKNKTTVYTINNSRLQLFKTYPFTIITHFQSPDSVYYTDHKNLFWYDMGKSVKVLNNTIVYYPYDFVIQKTNRNFHLFYDIPNINPVFSTSAAESVYGNVYSPESNSLYFATGSHLMRVFPYIFKYPRLYNNTNSGQIFSLNQTSDGKIWAGSYDGNISIIENNKVTESKIRDYRIMSGGISIGNKMVLNTEGGKGILLFEDLNRYKKISDTITSFYNYISKDGTFYSGTSGHGLMYKPLKDIKNPNIKWKFAGKKEGISLLNCLTVVEDKFGNIWTGRTSEGISVFQPSKNKGKTWKIDKNEITFGVMSLLKDEKETLWFGTGTGNLVYWDGKHQNDFSVKNFKKINHPLLNDSDITITFLHQWKNHLIIGATDKVLLFDLENWYKSGKVLVRYLNPVEASFSSVTEQNTVLADFRNQTVWFSTSDMLYQWDIENWLKLPVFKVEPALSIRTGNHSYSVRSGKTLQLKPTENSLNIDILYQTKDNLPRYMYSQLVKENEKFTPGKVSTQNKLQFQNLSSGKYVLYTLVCQRDGTYSVFEYPIIVKKFLWQNWWFWGILSFIPVGLFFYYFRNKREIEKQKKEIAQLNAATLSSQFRPNFMLNALNSLGTDMDDKPHAEKVISRIGENISLMYDYSQNKTFYIPFENEWKLVENTIEIQKTIFIKELEVSVKNKDIIPDDYNLPMGIIQVCVENALLHGVRHRKNPPYSIQIEFRENSDFYYVDITDNGVGREKSAKIYNFKRKGTGFQNIFSLLKIINSAIPKAIELKLKDASEGQEYTGTNAHIKLMKNVNYDKLKL